MAAVLDANPICGLLTGTGLPTKLHPARQPASDLHRPHAAVGIASEPQAPVARRGEIQRAWHWQTPNIKANRQQHLHHTVAEKARKRPV